MTRAQISRETPLHNRPVIAERYSPGGAANVAWNLADLGVGEVSAFTVFGDDWRGVILGDIFDRLAINREGIIIQDDWRTPFYGKVVLHGLQSQQEDARLDFINDQPLSKETEVRLLAGITKKIPDLDALIICDMIPGGIVTPVVTGALVELAEKTPRVFFLADSRENLHSFKHMVLKPNEIEASHLLFPDRDPSAASVGQLIEKMTARAEASGKPAYITAGEQGCWLCAPPTAIHIPAVPVSSPLDTVGAGDTFGAALTAALASGAEPVEAGFVANLASAVTIRKVGVTGTASAEEILSVYDALGSLN
jgi:rfaE bifunctional protein kinase chain/domain